MAAEAMFIKKL